MTTRRLPEIALPILLCGCVFLAALGTHQTNRWLQARVVERAADGQIRALPDGKALHVLSLGFENVVADLFWVRTVYYVGDSVSSDTGWPAAEALANLVTDVDPHFDSVYVLMASVLGGLRSDPDAAIRLLEKGAAVSNYWRIHFLLGFQYFMEKGDYEKGAKALERAMALGGPEYLQFLVSRLYAHGGEPATAMQFIAARLQNEENAAVRAKLQQRYADLWINRDLGLIDASIETFRAANRRTPKSIAELVVGGFLAAAPRDPRGGAYAIVDGRAHTDLPYEDLKLKLTRGGPGA